MPKAELRIYLGRSLAASSPEPVGTPILAAVVSDEVAEQLSADPASWANLRAIGSALSRRDAGLFTEALAMANWHLSHGSFRGCRRITPPGLYSARATLG